jgi:hypothetical protein
MKELNDNSESKRMFPKYARTADLLCIWAFSINILLTNQLVNYNRTAPCKKFSKEFHY